MRLKGPFRVEVAQPPEMDSAEKRMRNPDGPWYSDDHRIIAAELDRLRAVEVDLRADLRSKEIALREHDTDEKKLEDWAEISRRQETALATLRAEIARLQAQADEYIRLTDPALARAEEQSEELTRLRELLHEAWAHLPMGSQIAEKVVAGLGAAKPADGGKEDK